MRKKKVVEELIPEEVEEVKEVKEIPEFYILEIGETLSDVAKKFGVSESSLKELNGEVFGTNQIKVR